MGDITYIWTWEGWLYLATVIDLASRKVVGWAMAEHMRAELVCDALRMAIGARRPAPGTIFHSDRGTQYTSTEFTDLLADNRMASPGPASAGTTRWRRASWPRSRLKLARPPVVGRETQVRHDIVWYIEVFFNRNRLHSSLGYLTPDEYEATTIHHHKAAPATIVRLSAKPGQPQRPSFPLPQSCPGSPPMSGPP